jgi:hypothetical protein
MRRVEVSEKWYTRLSPTPRNTRQPACQSFMEKSLSLPMPGENSTL